MLMTELDYLNSLIEYTFLSFLLITIGNITKIFWRTCPLIVDKLGLWARHIYYTVIGQPLVSSPTPGTSLGNYIFDMI